MKHVTVCGNCGDVLINSHGPQQWCRPCYLSVPFPRLGITLADVVDCADYGYTLKDSAFVLGVSYVQLRRVVNRFGLRDRFPSWGASGRWIAARGYAGDAFKYDFVKYGR